VTPVGFEPVIAIDILIVFFHSRTTARSTAEKKPRVVSCHDTMKNWTWTKF